MPKPLTDRQTQTRAQQATQRIKLHGITEPKLLSLRDRRPVPGLEDRYEVTRTGRVWSHQKRDFMVDTSGASWPGVTMSVHTQILRARADFLASLAWLTPEQRAWIRSEYAAHKALPDAGSFDVDSIAAKFEVGSYAIKAVLNIPELLYGDIEVVKQVGAQSLPGRQP